MAKKKKNDLVRPEGMRAAEAAYVFPIPEANLLLQSHYTKQAQWTKKNLLSAKSLKKQDAENIKENQDLYISEKQLAEEYGSGKRNLFNSNKDLNDSSKGLRKYRHNREGARNLHPDALRGYTWGRDALPTMTGTDYDPDWVGNAVSEINSNIPKSGKVEESNLSASENITPMAKKPKKPMANGDGVPVMSAQQMIDLLPPDEVAKRQRQDARTDKKNARITPAQLAQEKKRRLNPSSKEYEQILSDVREAGGSYTIGPNKHYPEGTSHQGTTSTKDTDMASKKGKKDKKDKASGAGKNMTPAVEAVVNKVEDSTSEATTEDAPAKTKSSRTRTPEQQAARTQRERAKREGSKEKTDAPTSASDATTTEIPVTPTDSKDKSKYGSLDDFDDSPPSSETPPSTMPKSIFGTVAEQKAGTAPKPAAEIGYPHTNVPYGGRPDPAAWSHLDGEPEPQLFDWDKELEPQLFDWEKETANDGEQSTVLPPRLRERMGHFSQGAKNWAQAMLKPSAPQAVSPQASQPPTDTTPTDTTPRDTTPRDTTPASPYPAPSRQNAPEPSMSAPDYSVNKGAYAGGNINNATGATVGNTHTQKISGGYGPVTATTSGSATSSGKGGVTASTSGNATSGHPRAQNASRGSRPTNKG